MKSARNTPSDASAALLPVVARSGSPSQPAPVVERALHACAHSRLLSMTEFCGNVVFDYGMEKRKRTEGEQTSRR